MSYTVVTVYHLHFIYTRMNCQLLKLMLSAFIAVYITGSASAIIIPDENAPTELQNSTALRAVSTGLNQFAAEFYKKTAENLASNLICSPISASTLLSMTAHGAAGDTENEMRTSLHLPNDRAMGLEGFQSLIDGLNNVKKVKLSVANKIFIDRNFSVKQEFKEITTNKFRSEVQNLNLMNREEASKIINTWCEEKTQNLIKDVISPDDLIDALMVLVNAVYFKGIWKTKFDPKATINKTFYIHENTTDNDVPMMTQLNKLNYGPLPALDAVFVELPYESETEDDSTSMFIIYPNEIGGLKKAQDNIEKIDFKQLHDQKQMQKIKLTIPKFKIESTIDLKPILNEMGIRAMFAKPDFRGISDSPLSVSKVIQKALIEVNEEGSRAAAVTAIVAVTRTAMYLQPDRIVLTIDRPFIYAIYHAPTNTILFQGHILQLPA